MKKFTAIIICLLMVFACNLAGCATFSINKEKYYNEVLAKVGNTKITRFDLLNAYNSYGKTYFGSDDEASALNETLNMLIERESLYQYALSQGDLYKPTEFQVNEIVGKIFDSLDSQMESYVESAQNLLGIEKEDVEEETVSDDKTYLQSDYAYKKRAEVYKDGDAYKVRYIYQEDETISDQLLETKYLQDYENNDIVSAIKTAYLIRLEDKEYPSNVERKAKQLLIEDLINYEKYLLNEDGKHYSKTFNDLLYRYIERNFNSQIESQYLENIRTHYLKNETFDVEILLDSYKEAAQVAYELYDEEDELEDYKSAIKAIGTKGDTVLYHPNMEDGTKFGYFLHTLINFDEQQKTDIKNLANEPDEDKRQEEINKIVALTKVQARNLDTGKVEEDTEYTTLADIIAEYNLISGSYEDKLDKFMNFMFKYTGDADSTLVPGMPYVIGHTYSEDKTKEKSYSDMVEEFTAESVKLMKDGVKGTMSNFSMDNIGEMCVTEYGIHFIFYVGDVKEYDIDPTEYNLAYIQDVNKDENEDGFADDNLNLYNRIINPLTGKTYFDMLFDAVFPASSGSIYTSKTGYDDEEERLINLIQSQDGHKVTKYTTKINSTKTSLK